ncbi:MAG: LysR family transcriptional regulator substrate-binding protein, partial [Acidobacteriaceae bacterium]
AEETLQTRRNIVHTLAEMARTPGGQLVVSANEATCLYILPQVFAQFKRKHPRVSVSIARHERSRTLEAVLSQEVDFGVTTQPINDPRLTIVPVHKDEIVVITVVGHPLTVKSTAQLANVAAYPLILPKQGRTRDAINQMFFLRQLKPEISMELESNELIKRFAAAGVGVGFLARSNTQTEFAAGLLGVVELEDMHIARDMVLVYRKDKSLSRAAQAFIEIMQSSVGMPRSAAVS